MDVLLHKSAAVPSSRASKLLKLALTVGIPTYVSHCLYLLHMCLTFGIYYICVSLSVSPTYMSHFRYLLHMCLTVRVQGCLDQYS